MARNKVLCLVLLTAVTVLGVPAQSNDAVSGELRARGYTVENPRTEGGRPTWDLTHDEGAPFSLSMIGSLTEERAIALEAIRDVVFSLEGLVIRRTRVVFEESRATAVVSPREYVIDGRDYAGYMPAGMQFIYDDALAFDFRMLADNLALRVNGQFLTEEQFVERIVRAIDNPAAYIESSDPQFLARRLEEQQNLLDSARSTNLQQDQAIADLRNTDQEILEMIAETIRLGETLIREEVRRAEDARQELQESFEAALQELERESQQALVELTEQLQAFREGAVALAGRTLFGSLRELDPIAVARVVELRSADPELAADDARDRVNDELPEDAAPLHNRHVQAIYAFFFNDYR